jgi:hypothetical protein
MTGKKGWPVLYIASMKMKGTWADKPNNTQIINVTSMQGGKSILRRDFSPMTHVENEYKGYYCFENYWQSGKRYDGIDQNKFDEWWLNQTSGKRRYPGSKNKKVLYSVFEDGIQRDYVDSRKNIYVPFYHELVKNTLSINMCKELLIHGRRPCYI